MKPELRLKHLRKEMLAALDRKKSSEETQFLPWYLLRRLVNDQSLNLSDELRESLLDCCNTKNIARYFELQRYNSPTEYSGDELHSYRAAASVLSFLKKYPFGKVANLDPLQRAVDSFYRAEKLCRITNKRLKWFRTRGFRLDKKRQGLHGIFHAARLKISTWLGPLDLNKIHDQSRHGPGGAIGVSGRRTTAYYKYAAPEYSVTPRAVPYAISAILADPHWRRYIVSPDSFLGDKTPSPDEAFLKVFQRMRVTTYNKVTFVPKTALTHRAIAIEPLMNIYLQLGVGNYIRDCLRKVGVDLTDQSRNQSLARIGSTDTLGFWARPASLDLSMASDTISVELVKELLPEDWFNLLSDLRSEEGLYEGQKIHWAKFCSMGNGFTFPLESLLFYALVSSVIDETCSYKKSVSVYGDDIIVPGNSTLRVIEVLNYAGFKVNTEKSFAFGPFRESCGKDWWLGRDVRPFFLKREMKTSRDMLLCRNHFYLNGEGPSLVDFIDRRFPKILSDNLLGPVTMDLNGHLFTPFDVAQKSRCVLWDRQLQTWSYWSAKDTAKTFRGTPGPLWLQVLEGIKTDEVLQASLDSSYGRVVLHSESFPDGCFRMGSRDRYLLAKWARDLGDKAPSKGLVTQRSATCIRLATQVSNHWRND